MHYSSKLFNLEVVFRALKQANDFLVVVDLQCVNHGTWWDHYNPAKFQLRLQIIFKHLSLSRSLPSPLSAYRLLPFLISFLLFSTLRINMTSVLKRGLRAVYSSYHTNPVGPFFSSSTVVAHARSQYVDFLLPSQRPKIAYRVIDSS